MIVVILIDLVVVVVVLFVVVVAAVVCVVVFVVCVGQRNFTLKFGQKWFNNYKDIVVVVVDYDVVVLVYPCPITLKFG